MSTDGAAANRSELATRAAVGAVLVAGALTALWLGGMVFWILLAAVSLGVFAEWAQLAGAGRAHRRLLMFALSVPLAIMGPLAAGPDFFALGLLAGAAGFAMVVTRRSDLAGGILYAGLPVLAIMLMRDQPRGLLFTFWLFGVVWLCDIGAYFAGRGIGGPRLAPAISPNKTWAGLIGGIAAASLFAGALHLYQGLPWRLTLATPLIAAIAQAGDLYESWLKRRAGVKDSGTLLPGHGGLLDRLDGMIAAAPVAAFLVVLPQVQGLIG